jgi:hypothetical protein
MGSMKETKDLTRTVRVNGNALKDLEAKGWSTQRIVDWAMKRLKKGDVKPQAKKG